MFTIRFFFDAGASPSAFNFAVGLRMRTGRLLTPAASFAEPWPWVTTPYTPNVVCVLDRRGGVLLPNEGENRSTFYYHNPRTYDW